ncbi:MAG: type II toxin-antitoxin system RelE/ParE family toxin [Chlamydiota bacterium]
MVIRSFQDESIESFFKDGKIPSKKGWGSVRAIAQRKLDILHYASKLKDLRSPPGNRLESLSGDLKGYYSIRINDQWRIIFKWDSQPYDVGIVDYH